MAKQRVTLRQRLRADAEKKLDAMLATMKAAGERVCDEHGMDINPALLMQLASQPTQGKTLRHDLVTAIANEKERALEKLYNDQLDMLQEDKHA